MADTLPAFYFFFFWLIEPTLAVAGSIYAIVRPHVYALDLLPPDVERFTTVLGNTIRGRMAVGALGSCFSVLAMISYSLFPIFKWHTPPALQQKLVTGLLVPLLIGDFIHIAVTLIPLPADLRVEPWRWTQLIHGNIDVTVVLILVRTAWLLGIGRFSPASSGITVVETEGSVSKNSSPALRRRQKAS